MTQFVYGALIAVVLTGGGATAVYFTAGPGAPQMVALGDDLCRTDRELSAHRVFVVDTTDVLSDNERRHVRRSLDREADAALPYERVSVVSIESNSPYAPKRLFSGCAPKKAADASPISENPRIYQAVWKHRFAKPLDDAIDEEMAARSQDRSPIIESLWAISRFYDFGPEVRDRRIVIASDMLQNTPDFSQYHRDESFKAYERTEFGRLHLPNLSRAHIEIEYLVRPGTLRLQTKKHMQFWIEFFRAAGAANVEIVGGTQT